MSIPIDFYSHEFIRKCKSKANDLLILKAVGLAKRRPLTILDTCGGRGQDAALMAAFQGEVLCLERNQALYEQLQAAYAKLSNHNSWKSRLQIIHTDALQYLPQLAKDQYPDVIYIDPMYPHTTKNPRNKTILRDMRILVGDDTDADQLLKAAWGKALERIVVKRPKRAPSLANTTPSYQLKGNSTRFDIYLNSLWQT